MPSKMNRTLWPVAGKPATVAAPDHPPNIMPKTTNGLWAKLIEFENLYGAFQDARHGKRYRMDVMRFAVDRIAKGRAAFRASRLSAGLAG